jgi:cytochrome c biogenesis protein CcmG/thiol:disulfide interchange protein DsbE
MKNLIIVLFFLSFITSYSQTKYYTTDEKNRVTESEIKSKLLEMESKMSEALGKKFYVNLVNQNTEIKRDSILFKVTFNISDKKQDELMNSGPLSEFKNKDFPKFSLKTLSGEHFNFEQLNGKPTMINFWFTKCAPCIDEMPVLNQIAETYKNDFNFIAITYETDNDVEKFLKKHPFGFKHLVNAKKFTDSLGIKAYPLNLFLDKNGVLKYILGGISYERLEGGKLKMGEGNEIIEIIEKLK